MILIKTIPTMKFKLLLFLFFMTFLTLTSCEYKGPYYYKIQNETDFEAHVFFSTDQALDSLNSIEANTTKTFYMKEDLNGMRDLEEKFLSRSGIDTVYIEFVPDSLSLLKNPMLRYNWEYSTLPLKKDKEGLAGDNIYTFVISSSDVE